MEVRGGWGREEERRAIRVGRRDKDLLWGRKFKERKDDSTREK